MFTQNLCIDIYSSIMHKSPKSDITQLTFNRRMNKQNVMYSYNGIIPSNKKERHIGTHNNMDASQKH